MNNQTFKREDLVSVYLAAYESSGDISMLLAFDEDVLNEYENLHSCGELGSIYHAEVLKDSELYRDAVESDMYLKECISEMIDN